MIDLKQANACGKADPLSLLPMVASSSPANGLALSVTFGDSSPKGRASGVPASFAL